MTDDELRDYERDRAEFGLERSAEDWIAFLLWRIGEGVWTTDSAGDEPPEPWQQDDE